MVVGTGVHASKQVSRCQREVFSVRGSILKCRRVVFGENGAQTKRFGFRERKGGDASFSTSPPEGTLIVSDLKSQI